MTAQRELLAAYARFYETLTRDRLDGLRSLVAPGVRFKDPFNDVRGADAMIRVMARMYDHGEPGFEMLDCASGERAHYFLWRYTVDRRQGAASAVIDGMTEIRFDAEGRVTEHIDHWDAAEQVYEKVPLLGGILRGIKRMLQA
jgi:hypothetical protein